MGIKECSQNNNSNGSDAPNKKCKAIKPLKGTPSKTLATGYGNGFFEIHTRKIIHERSSG